MNGLMRTPTEVSDCENSGDISFTKSWVMGEEDLKTENENGEQEDAEWLYLSVMAANAARIWRSCAAVRGRGSG